MFPLPTNSVYVSCVLYVVIKRPPFSSFVAPSNVPSQNIRVYIHMHPPFYTLYILYTPYIRICVSYFCTVNPIILSVFLFLPPG